jgi:predicted alpha/beta hydrolase
VAASLAERGIRAVAFDFRGHGESTPGNEWGYDDLVRRDLPAVVECVRMRGEGKPVVVIGHSLGGHVALAAQGCGYIQADAIVAVATNVWMRAFEPSPMRWAAKAAIARAMLAVSRRAGRFPARRLRIGSDDASDRYLHDLFRAALRHEWQSADGKDDYLLALNNVRVPVAAVLGSNDVINCHPASGEAFIRRCRGPLKIFHTVADHMSAARSSAVIDAIAWGLSEPRG